MPRDLTQGPGATMVPGPRFRDPVARCACRRGPKPVGELRPSAPPPRPTRTVSDGGRTVTPSGRVAPPQVRSEVRNSHCPSTASRHRSRCRAPSTTLSQPAPMRRAEPRPLPPAPGQLPTREAPRAKPQQPQEIVPPYQQLQKPFPAEPARTPPAAPPTIPAAGSRHGASRRHGTTIGVHKPSRL